MASSDFSDEKVKKLLEAASSGRLHLLKKVAKQLDKAKGIAEIIKEIKEADGCGAFHLAAAQGKTEICQYLVEDLNFVVDFHSVRGETPLFHAAMGGHVVTTRYLIGRGAVIVAADHEGFAPLHVAAQHGKHEIVELLLSLRVPVDLEYNGATSTALTLAAIKGQCKTMEIFLEHNANVDKAANNMFTPLMCSVYSGSLKCMKHLIEAGADLNLKCPLAISICRESIEILKCLLKAGAAPNVRTENGLLLIEISAMRGKREIMQMLFPLTSPVLEVENWSVRGILEHVKSDTFKKETSKKAEARSAHLKVKGEDAFKKKDYLTAVGIYSVAIKIDPANETLYSNRSLCWHRMGVGERALTDAHLSLRPDWPKAYYRVGAAFMLLKDYDQASKAYLDGLKLGDNEEIGNAFWYATDCKDRTERGLEIQSYSKFSEPVDFGNFFHPPPSCNCCFLGEYELVDIEFGYGVADDL